MREPQTKTIDGRLYEITPLPATQGTRLFVAVMRVVGPALEKVKSFAEARDAVMSALGSLAERMDADNLEKICALLASQTNVEAEVGTGKLVPLSKVYDVFFAGDLLGQFAWMTFALEVNLGPLLRTLAGRVEAARAPAKGTSPSKSPDTSTGASTG